MTMPGQQYNLTSMFTLATERLHSFWVPQKIHTLVSGKKFAAVFVWLSIIATAWFLAKACALAAMPPALPAAPAFSSTAALPDRKSGSGMPPMSHFAVLETNNLFNLKSHAPTMTASAPKTLNAILMGTVEAPLQEDARAVIQHQGKQHMLRPGQDIAGFVVKEVRRGIVVLEAGDRPVELVIGNTGNAPLAGKSAAPMAQNKGRPEAETVDQ